MKSNTIIKQTNLKQEQRCKSEREKGRQNLDFIAWILNPMYILEPKSTLIEPNYPTLFPPNGVWEWESETLTKELLKPATQGKRPKHGKNRHYIAKTRAVHGRQCTGARANVSLARSTVRPCHPSRLAARSRVPHAQSCFFRFASVDSFGAPFDLYSSLESSWMLSF